MARDSYVPIPNTLTIIHGSPLLQSGVIEQGAALLHLQNTAQYNEQILIRAARDSEENDRIPEAIKLYNLAGDYGTVISCLAQALGNTLTQAAGETEKGKIIERTAVEILRHYERTNRAVGKDRDAAVRLLRIREALNAKSSGRFDVVLEVRSHPSLLIPSNADDYCRLWSPRISFLSMGMLQRLHGRPRSSKTCMMPCNATYKSICR
jgi:hypothetical protein